MNNIAEDRRKFERFELSFPATITVEEIDQELQVNTKDISAGGAFFHTAELLKKGVKVRIEVIISNDTLKKLTGYESCVKVLGTVVRCEQEGMAVSFDGKEKIMPLRSKMDN